LCELEETALVCVADVVFGFACSRVVALVGFAVRDGMQQLPVVMQT
jgi:hypothetical protein